MIMAKTFFQKIFTWVVAAAMLFGLAACGGNATFIFATTLQNCTVEESEYSFTAVAMYGSESCALTVTCNGTELSAGENGYIASLSAGENTIVLRARHGNASDVKEYTVIYNPSSEPERADLAIETDLGTAQILNGKIRFSAAATFNDAACALLVTHNGTNLVASNGSYSAELEAGNNIFVLTARSGEHVLQKEHSIEYGPIWINTDLVSKDTAMSQLSFMALAGLGDTEYPLTVTVNGEILLPQSDGLNYVFTMPSGGEYIVVLSLTVGRITAEQTYTVRYADAPPYFEELTLEDGAQIRGSILTFSIAARDGLGLKLDSSKLEFAVDLNAADGKESFTALTSADLHLVWSDSERTSYRLNLTQGIFKDCKGTPFLLRITADAFGNSVSETFEMTYVGADPDGAIGEVVFSIEGFTIDCGYFLEPQPVTIYENVPFAVTLCEILEENGWTYTYTGKPESGFYLASVTGLDLTGNRISESLLKIMEAKGQTVFSVSKDYDGSVPVRLGEFDYAQGSGWMYSVNGSFPNYGFSDYYPQNGDVVRVQFTLCLGSDIGGGSALGGGGSNFLDFADYADIMAELAAIAANDYYGKGDAVYREAIEVISVWNATQEQLDGQLARLREVYGGGI